MCERIRETRASLGRKLIEAPGYTFRIFVTSLAEPPEEIWRDSNHRAEIENRIVELKHDLGRAPSASCSFMPPGPPSDRYCCCLTC